MGNQKKRTQKAKVSPTNKPNPSPQQPEVVAPQPQQQQQPQTKANNPQQQQQPQSKPNNPQQQQQPQTKASSTSKAVVEPNMEPRIDYGVKSYVAHGRLKGKVALVTGGESGIGRAVALAFAREGASVAISFPEREQKNAEETRRMIEDGGQKCILFPADMRNEEANRKLVERAAKQFNRIDVLVLNAAMQEPEVQRIDQIDHQRVMRAFETNVAFMFDVTRYALPHMKPGSSIVTSIQPPSPRYNMIDYVMIRGAIESFTEALSQLVIERGIRVNAITPGSIRIPPIFEEEREDRGRKQPATKIPPFPRVIQPVEVSPSFVFLASDEATCVNGERIPISSSVGGQVTA